MLIFSDTDTSSDKLDLSGMLTEARPQPPCPFLLVGAQRIQWSSLAAAASPLLRRGYPPRADQSPVRRLVYDVNGVWGVMEQKLLFGWPFAF